MAVVRNMAGEKLAEVRIRKRIRMHLFIRTLGAYEYYANMHLPVHLILYRQNQTSQPASQPVEPTLRLPLFAHTRCAKRTHGNCTLLLLSTLSTVCTLYACCGLGLLPACVQVRAEYSGFVVGWSGGVAFNAGQSIGSCGLPDGLPMVVDYDAALAGKL
jgi:hypothetical protein